MLTNGMYQVEYKYVLHHNLHQLLYTWDHLRPTSQLKFLFDYKWEIHIQFPLQLHTDKNIIKIEVILTKFLLTDMHNSKAFSNSKTPNASH